MAYVNGTATSMADLLAALQAACTANGWTLAGNVLYKGMCYVSVTVVSGYLVIQGGTGIDGSNALTGAGPYVARLGLAWTGDTLTFPVTYGVHIGTSSDEVYLVCNYETTRWQWMAFGCSPVSGLPGTGNWYAAMLPRTASNLFFYLQPASGGANTTGVAVPGLFCGNYANLNQSGFFHHGLDGGDWSTDANPGAADALSGAQPFIPRLPNAWNGETSLVPIQPCVGRPSSKTSMVGDLAHARYVRNDNYAPGDIITLGADRWKVYPWHQQNAAMRDGGTGVKHTGTLGWAIRYDGP